MGGCGLDSFASGEGQVVGSLNTKMDIGVP
jgi:hypothetical protein